jgi:hypothetical protein
MAISRLKAYAEFADFITSEPKLEDVANYHLSDESQATIRALLDANRDGKLSREQAEELDEYERLEYIIQTAKIRAYEKLDSR